MQEVRPFEPVNVQLNSLSHLWHGYTESVEQQSAQALGVQVVLRHYLVTVRGRTGYLDPKWEECTMTGNSYAQHTKRLAVQTPI